MYSPLRSKYMFEIYSSVKYKYSFWLQTVINTQTLKNKFTGNQLIDFYSNYGHILRLINGNRLVNLGISKQQHLYLRIKNLI